MLWSFDIMGISSNVGYLAAFVILYDKEFIMKFSVFALGLALTLASASPAFAAASPTPMATLMPSPAAMASSRPNQVGEVPLAMSVTTYREVAYGERASKIIGATVYNDKRQAIGKVSDLVINPQNSVSIVIVSVGGFLGLGAKDVAISAQEFQFMPNRLVLPRATKQVLEQLPSFHYSHK